MLERNPCTASGCPGFCCQDIDLILTKFERNRLFPKAKRVDTLQTLAEIKKMKVKGGFYTSYRNEQLGQSGFVMLSLNGPCPNRNMDGGCKEHEEREHAARNFKIGCLDCNEIRKEHHLAPIFIELVE